MSVQMILVGINPTISTAQVHMTTYPQRKRRDDCSAHHLSKVQSPTRLSACLPPNPQHNPNPFKHLPVLLPRILKRSATIMLLHQVHHQQATLHPTMTGPPYPTPRFCRHRQLFPKTTHQPTTPPTSPPRQRTTGAQETHPSCPRCPTRLFTMLQSPATWILCAHRLWPRTRSYNNLPKAHGVSVHVVGNLILSCSATYLCTSQPLSIRCTRRGKRQCTSRHASLVSRMPNLAWPLGLRPSHILRGGCRVGIALAWGCTETMAGDL